MTRILFLITAEEMYDNQTQETFIGDENYVMTNTYDANILLTNQSKTVDGSAVKNVKYYYMKMATRSSSSCITTVMAA